MYASSPARHVRSLPVARRLRVPLAALVIAALAAFAAIVVPLSAHAAPVALSGSVVGPNNKVIADVTVTAVPLTGGSNATAKTSASGSFTFPALVPGDYTLQFPATATTYPQYLGGTSQRSEAQIVALADGAGNRSYIRAALAASGALAGKVTRSGNKALAGYSVTAYFQGPDGAWTPAKTVKTSSKGSYSLTGLEPGSYRLKAFSTAAAPPYAPLFSGGAHDLTQASTIVAVAGKSVTTNFVLGAAGKVTGVVTGAVGNQKLAGVVVTPFHLVGPSGSYTGVEELTSLAKTTTASGAFTLSGLAPGDYTLKFTPKTPSLTATTYESTYLGNHADALSGTYFTVSAGKTVTGKNIQLGQAAHITGEVVDAAFWPGTSVVVPHLRVILENAGVDPFDGLHTPRSVVSDNVGAFDFTGVAAGAYDVYVGSLADTDASDGITEDTTWERVKHTGISVSAGVDQFVRYLADEKGTGLAVVPGSEPAIVPGLYKVGGELSVSPGSWTGAPGAITETFQWLRNGLVIPGETMQSHTVSPADAFSILSVRVTAHNFAYGTAEYTTVPTPNIAVGDAPTPDTAPAVTGTPAVGFVLSSTLGTWTAVGIDPSSPTDPGIVWTYTWQLSHDGSTGWTSVGGSNGGDAPSYTVTSNDLANGPYIRLLLTGARWGYDNVQYPTPTQLIVPGVATEVTPPTVTKSGSILTLHPGIFSPAAANSNIFYQWQIFDDQGALSQQSNFPTLDVSGLAGMYIVGSTKTSVSGISGPFSTVIAQKGTAPTGTPENTIAGVVAVDATVTAPAVTWTSPTPDAVAYSWQYLKGSTWTTIAGASSAGYVVPSTYLGKVLRSVQTATKTGYLPAVRTSVQTSAVALGAAPMPVGGAEPTLGTGSVAINAQLSLDAGAWTPVPSTFSYIWKTSVASGVGPYTNVKTTTTPFFTIPTALEGKYLYVDVVAGLPAHTSGSYTLALGQVAAGVLVSTVKPVASHTGSVYKVTNGTWSPAATGITFDWRVYAANGVPTGGASTASTFDTAGNPNAPVDVIVGGTKPGYTTGTVTVMAKPGTLVPSGPVVVDTSVPSAIDTEFLAHPAASYGPTSVTTTYQWQYLKGTVWTNVTGQDGQSFYPTGSLLAGKQVRAAITVKNPLYTPFVHYSTPLTVSTGAAATVSISPSFDAAPGVGRQVTVSPGVWSETETSFSYQWQRETSPGVFTNVSGATKATFTPTAAMHGTQLRVVVTHHWAGHANGTTTLTATVGDGQLAVTKAPVVTKSGSTLKVSNGTWNASAPAFAYEWRRYNPADNTSVVIGTASSYMLTPADAGAFLTARVAATQPLYNIGVAVTIAQTGAKIAPVTAQSVTGPLVVGSTLTANAPDWTVGAPTVDYSWLRNGVAVGTGPTYMQGALDLGKTISVKITASKPGYATGVTTLVRGVTLSATLPVSLTPPTVAVLRPTNNAEVDSPMVASPGTWSLTGLTFTYQWLRNGTPIVGATAATYVPVPNDALSEIRVAVTAEKALTYSPVSAQSESHFVDYGISPQITSPLVGGTLLVTGTGVLGALGTTLSAPAIAWDQPVTMTYQWQADSADIAGATSSTLVLSPSAFTSGQQIRLIVRGSRPGHGQGAGAASQVITIP